MASAQNTAVSAELFDEILLCARYGDLTDLQEYFTSLSSAQIVNLLRRQDPHGNTPLHFCAANGHLDVVNLFLARDKTGMDLSNEGGNTPLHWASLNGHLETVKVLVDAGADVKRKNRAQRMPIDEAESQGKESIVLWLLALDLKREKDAGLLDVDSEETGEDEVNVNMSAGAAETQPDVPETAEQTTNLAKDELARKVDKMNMLD